MALRFNLVVTASLGLWCGCQGIPGDSTPTPSPTATPTGTPTPDPTSTPAPTPPPTSTPTSTPSSTPTPSPTATPSPTPAPTPPPQITLGNYVVIGYSELGMHCMNEDFSELMLLPPYNNLRAQVIERRGEEPHLVSGNAIVSYSIPSNTHSSDKVNFWTYAPALLGVNLAADLGLAGKGLSGTMDATGDNDWVATGIPITPRNDAGALDPYALATITVTVGGAVVAENAEAVVPVSWEIRCDLCHNAPGISTATDILQKHDQRHGTDLEHSKPVLCAGCHADAALGLAGQAGISTLSSAMHGSHADRMSAVNLEVDCYACHPGVDTQCLRDVHLARGMTCLDCHQSMIAVADPVRRPWVDEPGCGSSGCHARSGFEFEQPGTLYRESKGHGGVHCAACHGSPHAITPTVTAVDNRQAEALQGHAGPIDTCAVCHRAAPDDGFFHHVDEDD